MNKVNKLEDFLDRMQRLLDNAKKQGHIIVRIEDLERAFPELKEESEDEKIIRDIKVVLESSATKFFKEEGKMPIWYDRVIAWLEKKQSKDKKDRLCSNSEYDKDILGAIEYCIKNNRPLEKEHLAWLEKQGKQKPVWSEDDKQNYQMLQKIICDSDMTANLANKLSDWLKSLKDRYTWIPSDTQMNSLACIIANAKEINGITLGDYDELHSLYKNLQELK